MQATYVILDLPIATLKNYKEISEIDFTNIFYLTQYIQKIIISPFNQFKNDCILSYLYFTTEANRSEIKIQVGGGWLSAGYVSGYIIIGSLTIAARVCVA